MADLLHVGAEFESYEDFKQTFEQYCKTTQVNDEVVKFVHSNAKYIKNGTLPNNEQKRLQYTMKTERCNFATKSSCEAAYELALHTKENGDRVLRLEKFSEVLRQSDQSSKEKLQSIMEKISNGIKDLPDEKCGVIAEIMENTWDRTEKNTTYKVDFTDYPSKNDAVYRVDIVYVSSPSKTLDRQSEDAPMADKHTDGVTENKPSKNRSSAKSYQADNDSDCFSLSSMGTELSDDSDDGNDANQTVNDGPGKKRLIKSLEEKSQKISAVIGRYGRILASLKSENEERPIKSLRLMENDKAISDEQ